MANPGFESAGARAGAALGWSTLSRARGSILALYAVTLGIDANSFSGAEWDRVGISNVFAAATQAPLGGTPDADSFVATVAAGAHELKHNAAVPLAAGTAYSFGVFLKKGTVQESAALRVDDGTNEVHAALSLATGRLLARSADNASFTEPTLDVCDVDAAFPGWVLVTLSFLAKADLSVRPAIALADASGNLSFTPPANQIFVWGAHLIEGPSADVETFAVGWGVATYATSLSAPTAALYDDETVIAKAFEEFESEWQNTTYLLAIAAAEAASYDTAPEAFEDFGEGWLNDSYALTIGAKVAASYDTAPEAFEDFGEGWLNDSYITSIVSSDTAVYDGEPREDFEEVLDDVAVAYNSGTNTFTKVGHSIVLDTRLMLTSEPGGEVPGGADRTYGYFAVTIAADTFQLSKTASGAPFAFTSNGDKVVVRGDPSVFWNGEGINRYT